MGVLDRIRKRRRGYSALQVRQIPTETYFQLVREQLAASGRATVRVTGVSMRPFLTPVRDTVEIVPPDATLKVGDIVLFDTRCGRYILHRVTRVGEHDFDMRGDNTAHGEKHLPRALLVGMVDSATRNGKKIRRGSFRFRAYAAASPLHYTWRALCSRLLYPLASRVYHIFVPRRNGGN